MSIVEHGDSMDVTIDGQLRTVPKCTCGKCIVRRLRGNNFPAFPYNKNMCSTYIDDMIGKLTSQKTLIPFTIVVSIILLRELIVSISLPP